VPAVHALAVSVEDGRAQGRLGPRAQGHDGARRGRRAHPRDDQPGRARRLRAALSLAIVRRHAAARRHCPRARLPPGGPADGRAVQRGRRADARRPAGTAARALAQARPDRGVRHPRRRRRRLSVEPRRGAEGGAGHGGHRCPHRVAGSARPDRDPRAARLSRLPGAAACATVRRRGAQERGGGMTDSAHTDRPAAVPALLPQRPSQLGWSWNTRLIGVAFIGLLLVLWEIAAVKAIFPPMSFPRISAILATWWQLVVSGELPSELLSSLWRMFAGYFIGVALGVALGLLMGYVRFFYNLLEPITEVLRPIPSPAYLPIVILFLGIDDEMKIFMIAFATLFPVLLNTYSGVRSVDPIQLQTARTFGVSGRRLLTRIVLPAASP